MKRLAKWLLVLAVLGGGGYLAVSRTMVWWKARQRPTYRTAKVSRGDVSAVRNATGTIQPELRVRIGSFVSGPIVDLLVEFNQEVKKDQVLARIDPRIYQANVLRDEASLATAKADVERVRALLQQARNDEKRAQALREVNEDYLSDTEMDQFIFNCRSLEAQVEVAMAAIKRAQAALELSKVNLDYTEIKSPVDGVVIDRLIDPGQMLAAQFQAPEMFIIAPNMREKMHVFASVNEADIGQIKRAKAQAKPVEFTVDAYPDELFQGKVYEIRVNPETVQNVVTYPVVVEAPNPDLKLLPGMTAYLTFHIDRHEGVLRIPNAALRFFPEPERVRPENRPLLDGTGADADAEDEEADVDEQRPARERAEAGEKRNRRHVWVVDEDLLRAVEVVTGLSDHRFTELVSGDLQEGQELVTGEKRGQ